jgi:hypothetical protein
VSGRPKAESHRPVVAVRGDGTRAQAEGRGRAAIEGVRRGCQTISRQACFGEDVAFDIGGQTAGVGDGAGTRGIPSGREKTVQQPLCALLSLLNTGFGDRE